MIIAYTGTSDFQEFDPQDFAKAGVEGKKVRFARNEPTEIDDELAEVLVAKDGIFGDFEFIDLNEVGEDTETDEEATEEQRAAAKKASKKVAKKAAASTDSGGAPTSGAGARTQSAGDGGGDGSGVTGTTTSASTSASSTR